MGGGQPGLGKMWGQIQRRVKGELGADLQGGGGSGLQDCAWVVQAGFAGQDMRPGSSPKANAESQLV